MQYEIRELGVGGILDQAIALVRDHFRLLLGIMLIIYVPVDLVLQWLTVLEDANYESATPAARWAGILLIVEALITMPLANGAIIRAAANAYLQQPITAGEALRSTLRRFVPILGTMFISGLFIGLGFLMLVIPGILFSLWWFLVIQVVVLEGLTGTAAMRRSKQLMTGNIGTAILLGLALGALQVAVDVGVEFIPSQLLRVVVGVVGDAIAFVFGAAGWVVFYFSCRSKHERFDLAILADAVGIDSPAPLAAESS